MTAIETLRAVERDLTRRGVPACDARDAAAEAWLAAWERAGGDPGASGLRRSELRLAAARLARPGRGGRSQGCARLPVAEVEPRGGHAAESLDALIDAGREASSSPAAAIEALRRAGCSLPEVGEACGVSGEAVRRWALGALPRPAARLALFGVLRALAA